MAYRYNEKTGEFEDIPQGPAQRRNSQPSTSHISTPPVVTQQPQSTSNDAGFFSTIGAIILNILPYAIGFLIVGTCS